MVSTVNKELPAGWRIASDLVPMGQDCDYIYSVQHWETWEVKRWFRRNRTVTGWRHLNGFGREDFAYQWAWDTIRAMEAAK